MKTGKLVGVVLGMILKIMVLVIVILAIYRGAVYAYDYGYRVFTEPALALGEGRSVMVAITEDMDSLEIGELFFSKGLVRDGKLFAVQYMLSEYRKEVGPGVFELSTAMTAEEMMAEMAKQLEKDSE